MLSVVLLKVIHAMRFRTKFLLFVSICVPPNNPITACGATSFPGYHSFPKWAIEELLFSRSFQDACGHMPHGDWDVDRGTFFPFLPLLDMFSALFATQDLLGGAKLLNPPIPKKNNGPSPMDPNFGVCLFSSPPYFVILI